jgi:hypothetical protein
LSFGFQANSLAFAKRVKKEATFKVRIENISDPAGLTAQDGSKYPFALSPGLFLVTDKKMDLFKEGKKADAGLEAQAEDGNPELLAERFLTKLGSTNEGVFNKPVGAAMPSPILPGGAFEFTFKASEGMKLNLVAMYGQSNDLFYASDAAISLFDKDGNPLTGDITGNFKLWDAGTEVNQAPGIGPDQGPRQKGPNTGASENGVVSPVKDGFTYPNTMDVLKITITAE